MNIKETGDNRSDIAQAICDIIFPRNATGEGQYEVFEALACLLANQASEMFCSEHAASAISEAVNAYLLMEQEEEEA